MTCLPNHTISTIYRYRKTGKAQYPAQYPARREGDPLWNVMSYGMVRPLSQGGASAFLPFRRSFSKKCLFLPSSSGIIPGPSRFLRSTPGPLLRRADFGVSSVPGDATVSPYPKNQAIFFINGPDTVSCPSVGPPASGFGERYPPG